MIGHITTLLINDHSVQNSALVTDLLSQYLTTNQDLNKLRENLIKTRKSQSKSETSGKTKDALNTQSYMTNTDKYDEFKMQN